MPCAPGSFYNFNKNECELCSIGFYQPSVGQMKCIPCPNQNFVTANLGSIRVNECKSLFLYFIVLNY